MKTEDTFLDSELLLGRLLRAKLVLRLHGIISAGLASLESDAPKDFLVGRDKVVGALIEVLGSLTVRPAHDAIQQSLAAQAARMALLWNAFYKDFLALSEWRTLSGNEIRSLGDRLISTYSEIEKAVHSVHSFQQVIDDETENRQNWERTGEMLSSMLNDLAQRKERAKDDRANIPVKSGTD